MTNVTPTPPTPDRPAADSINDNIQTSSPSLKATLIGLACFAVFVAVVTLVTIYYQSALP
ncbi:MAG: hypothetical protein ACRECO_17955 [Xanthobacteraceae bacterium]